MQYKNFLPFVIIALIVSGCTKQPELTKEELAIKLETQNIIIDPISKPVALSERTKGRAIGNVVVGIVVSNAAYGGGSGTMNHAQMQKELQMTMDLGRNISNSLPTGTYLKQGAGIDLLLVERLSSNLKQGVETNAQAENLLLSINVPLWEIGYVSMFSDYSLNYNILATISEKDSKNQYKSIKESRCLGSYQDTMPLDDWREDEYGKVQLAINDIVDECYEKFTNDFGL